MEPTLLRPHQDEDPRIVPGYCSRYPSQESSYMTRIKRRLDEILEVADLVAILPILVTLLTSMVFGLPGFDMRSP